MLHAVILTTHEVDYLAVKAHLAELKEEIHSQGTVYELGYFSSNDQNWEVAIAEVTAGNSDAALETERAIAHWQPNVVLSVGVATGLKDVMAGDIVAAIEVYNYDSGKETEFGFLTRPKIALASYRLEQRAKASAKSEDWLARITGERQKWTPKVVVGAIAAGEKEITSSQSEIYQLLQSNYGDALAVDVSGYGVLKAVHANAGTNGLIVRGITHVIDRDVTIDLAAARMVAAQHASAFAFEILAKLESASSFGLSPAQYSKLKQNLTDASKGLLSWKRTLRNNQQIERSELDELLNRISTQEFSTTIVLGTPGAGKSALMATLGNELVAKGYVVLAIKADQLNGAINTIEDLQLDLCLELHPADAIHAIASKEPIVVLVDQLDAISELLDRKSQRLNILLSLIQRLSGSKNIHIVATCREFEFRFGSQFARLAEIDRLVLRPPAWEKIAPILEASGHQPVRMGETLRELLQNPLHLNIFLDVAKLGDVFTSSQKLLGCLWEERVKKQPEAKKCISFLEELADYMTEEEVLWVPDSIADTSPEILQALEQAGLLMTNPENSTIGFSHQTYYDHTLARTFARGSKSLTDIVLERQDGLFIRPILLRILNYLRGTSPKRYEQELRKLVTNAEANNWAVKNKMSKLALHLLMHVPDNLKAKALSILQSLRLIHIRTHIYTLLVEFIGSQLNPEPVEVQLLTSLLKLDAESPKVLDATTGSPGWFRSLRDRPEFTKWLEKPVEQAIYSISFLSTAASFAENDVWNLLEKFWLHDAKYDSLSVRIIWGIKGWTLERVWLIKQVLQRHWVDWDTVAAIAEKVAETLPDSAPEIIRAHLDFLLAQASEASKLPPPELPADADEAQRSLHACQYNPLNPLKALLESESNFYEIEQFAKENPNGYLKSIWPWFVDLIHRISYDTSSTIISYRWDLVGDFKSSRSKIIQSLFKAITELARQDKSAFFKFFEQNLASDCLAIHRLLAYGLEVVASGEAVFILNYLLDDPRRFNLGSQSSSDSHKETEKLIAAICPYLQIEDLSRLEQSIREFRYSQPDKEMSADFRRKCLKYNREHRLSLLQAIPDQYLSHEARRLKEEEERAFPLVNLRKDRGIITGGFVGPRMIKEEMSRASDENLLNLFNELPDETGWNNPRRQWTDDVSRAGGAVIQSRIFGELVKDDPLRFLRLLPQLEPKLHESYIGAALGDLAETDFPANNLIDIIQHLDQRGFVSETFRSDAAHALQKIAEQHEGLPQLILTLLESWLPNHSQPELEHYRSKEEQQSDRKLTILFDLGSSHILPNGRGNVVRALAEGYLRQNPPDLAGWTKFINSQLGVEPHPAVWVDILSRMPPLLNGDRAVATELFDRVILNCPEVLQYAWALRFISRTIGWFEPKETVQCWLEMLQSNCSSFSQQAYGELLLLQYFQYQDKWSIERIRHHLATQENEAILSGLAHAASHLWGQQRCRAIAAEILYTLASSSVVVVQHAVANVFHSSRDCFTLDEGMVKIIKAVCKNAGVLLESANALIEIIEAQDLVANYPEITAEVCNSLVAIGTELTNPSRSTSLIAESLTAIAIQLHRQTTYRETGLQIFEQLLTLNLRETKSALEMLDRRPNRQGYYITPRRRTRRYR